MQLVFIYFLNILVILLALNVGIYCAFSNRYLCLQHPPFIRVLITISWSDPFAAAMFVSLAPGKSRSLAKRFFMLIVQWKADKWMLCLRKVVHYFALNAGVIAKVHRGMLIILVFSLGLLRHVSDDKIGILISLNTRLKIGAPHFASLLRLA